MIWSRMFGKTYQIFQACRFSEHLLNTHATSPSCAQPRLGERHIFKETNLQKSRNFSDYPSLLYSLTLAWFFSVKFNKAQDWRLVSKKEKRLTLQRAMTQSVVERVFGIGQIACRIVLKNLRGLRWGRCGAEQCLAPPVHVQARFRRFHIP